MSKLNLTFKQKSALRYILRNGPCEPRNAADGMVMRALVKRGILTETLNVFDLTDEKKAVVQAIVDKKILGF